MKVLITTSGVGSRLGEITKYMNKALVRVGPKPVISYIVESYPQDTRYVITLGYFGKIVREYLEIAYPTRNFEFVLVDKYEGDGSSLLYSMLQARKLLEEPFIYHACDTITDPINCYPDYNWIGGIRGGGSSAYASFSTLGSRVTEMHSKGFSNSDYLHVGLIGIKDFREFWNKAEEIYEKKPNDSAIGDVDVLEHLVCLGHYKVQELKTWFDIGNLGSLSDARAALKDGNFYVLDKLAESIYKVNGNVIKFFSDSNVLKKRVKRVEFLNGTVARIDAVSDSFYRYQFIDGELFSEVANQSNFLTLLEWAERNLWVKTGDIDADEFKNTCFEFYINKTKQRLNEFFTKKCLTDKVDIINGRSVSSVEFLLEKVDSDFLCGDSPSGFHGDFILDNIIKTNSTDFKLIDWRQDFGGDLKFGDKYYDIAKLAHNLVVNHKIVDENNYSVNVDNRDAIEINIHRLQSLVECEEILFKYLRRNCLKEKKVRILRALIWINMSPLHHHPFDLFLFYLGKYNLDVAVHDCDN
jgi:hypothetical protein